MFKLILFYNYLFVVLLKRIRFEDLLLLLINKIQNKCKHFITAIGLFWIVLMEKTSIQYVDVIVHRGSSSSIIHGRWS